jgi:small subunit ribosomal protein S1
LSQEIEQESGATPVTTEESAPEVQDPVAPVEAVDSGEPVVETTTTETETTSADAATVDVEKKDEVDPGKAAEAEKKTAELKARQARVAPLYRAFRGKRGISGRVEKSIKGGYEIRIGQVRAFCPHSQIDVQRADDPESFVGTTHQFLITQLRRGGEDVVVSRRAVMESERREEAAAVRATLIEGAVMLGRVSGLAKFGAFVDLGAGVTGLAHITEVSHGHINRVDQAVHIGEAVRVKILSLQDGNDRISLSIRQASEDPWASVEGAFIPAGVYTGKLLRFADFGAFVELSPGVEALAPASEFPPSAGGWRDGLEPGSDYSWRVLRIDAERRRISLTPGTEGASAPPELSPGVELNGKVQRIEAFGVFVWLAPGQVGLIPNALTGTPPGTELATRFPIASDVEVVVAGIDDRGRIRLSKKGAQRPQPRSNDRSERAPRPERAPRRRAPRPQRAPQPAMSDSTEGFGSLLADKLKDALG